MTALRVIWFVTILLCVVVPATTASDVQLADLPDVVRKTIVEQTPHATILHLRKTVAWWSGIVRGPNQEW